MPGRTLLLITDISGFTRFVSSRSAEEGVRMATEMLQIILRSNKLRLKLCEIEGDAVFLYSDKCDLRFEQISKQVGNTFRKFQDYLFHHGLGDQLGIKFIVHAGDCPTIHIGGKKKLFGQDVIRIHRLLKRESGEMNYLLVTDSAAEFLGEVPAGLKGNTEFEHLGTVHYRIFGPAFLWAATKRNQSRGVIAGVGGVIRQLALLSGSPNLSTSHG